MERTLEEEFPELTHPWEWALPSFVPESPPFELQPQEDDPNNTTFAYFRESKALDFTINNLNYNRPSLEGVQDGIVNQSQGHTGHDLSRWIPQPSIHPGRSLGIGLTRRQQRSSQKRRRSLLAVDSDYGDPGVARNEIKQIGITESFKGSALDEGNEHNQSFWECNKRTPVFLEDEQRRLRSNPRLRIYQVGRYTAAMAEALARDIFGEITPELPEIRPASGHSQSEIWGSSSDQGYSQGESSNSSYRSVYAEQGATGEAARESRNTAMPRVTGYEEGVSMDWMNQWGERWNEYLASSPGTSST